MAAPSGTWAAIAGTNVGHLETTAADAAADKMKQRGGDHERDQPQSGSKAPA